MIHLNTPPSSNML